MKDAISELKRSIERLEDPEVVHYTSEASKAEMLETLRGALAKLEAVPVAPPQPELTREYLIDLCERSIVPVEKWYNRDTPHTQEKVGLAWVLLKSGCEWRAAKDPKSDKNTIWIEIFHPDFRTFEEDRDYREKCLFYLPTESRLERSKGGDWY